MSAESRKAPTLLRWRDQQRHIDWRDHPLPLADRFGWHRGHYGRLEATNFGASLVVLPFGQASPPHSSRKEHIILVVEGEVEFVVGAPATEYRLAPYDALFIPAEIVYEYYNVGRVDALFYSITGQVTPGDSSPTYYLPGEDEPTAVHR